MRTGGGTGGNGARISVVSGYGLDPVTPRGQRTGRLVEALRENWQVELIAMPGGKPSTARPDGSASRAPALRQAALKPLRKLLLDRWEPWAARNLGRWQPEVDAALLIAAPWSPVLYASRRLSRAGTPYIVDIGDPWVLMTEATMDPDERLPPAPVRRARRAERLLWERASGAVVTTPSQQRTLNRLFPSLPILVRPNGYNAVPAAATPASRPPSDGSVLRIAHFGMLSPHRLDPLPLLEELRRSGRWETIVFSQFGDDFGVGLDQVAGGSLRIEHRRPIPWREVIERADEFDAALVVAYPDRSMMPSKTIEYSTLPLPRIALANPESDDATREYLRGRDGWLVLSNGEADLGGRVWEHVQREWTAAELAPPPGDAWPAVSAEIVDFLAAQVGRPGAPG